MGQSLWDAKEMNWKLLFNTSKESDGYIVAKDLEYIYGMFKARLKEETLHLGAMIFVLPYIIVGFYCFYQQEKISHLENRITTLSKGLDSAIANTIATGVGEAVIEEGD